MSTEEIKVEVQEGKGKGKAAAAGPSSKPSKKKSGGSPWFRKRDWHFLLSGISVKKTLAGYVKKNKTVTEVWAGTLAKYGTRPAIVFEGLEFTFSDIDLLSNRVAHFALEQGLVAGDTVALYMENRPEFFVVWLGLAKIGVQTALINYNLRNRPLVHSLKVSECKFVVYGSEQTDKMVEILDEIKDIKLYAYHSAHTPAKEVEWSTDLNELLAKCPSAKVPKDKYATAVGVRVKDALLYVYTSGTTGLPKAAIITHYRFLLAAVAFTTIFKINNRDRVYTTLPLFHSAGGMLGLGTVVTQGSVLLLRAKFSASKFWEECREQKATVIQYIGELCRYMVASPPQPRESEHCVRLAMGNGMRPDVWKQFQARFKVPVVGEFYAATEGAAALVNTSGHEGAIGFISPLVEKIFPNKIVRFDVETEEVIRGPNGFCQVCGPNEPGEFIAQILHEKGGVTNYSGYKDKEASNKKVLRDVFKKGDAWFRSGDLLKMDEEGFVYFVDRIGDTFRWKGENVSTAEVAEVLAYHSEMKADYQINVYGVEVPGHDGRAGMAAIEANPADVNLEDFGAYVCDNLAHYARPLFLRFMEGLETTATFKHIKVGLKKEGFNPAELKDPLFYLDGKTYKPLDAQAYAKICDGSIRL